jgi:hypothetical protein
MEIFVVCSARIQATRDSKRLCLLKSRNENTALHFGAGKLVRQASP